MTDLTSTNPADGAVVGTVPDLDAAAVSALVDAAAAALPGWRATPAVARGRILIAAAGLLMERAGEIAALITAEQGKPTGEARFEVMLTAEALRWFGEEARRLYGRTIPDAMPNRRLATVVQPVGVVLAVTPWNIPLLALPRKVAAATAAGCTVLLKPAEQTPLVAAAFVEVLTAAGMPAGVVNLVTVADPGPAVAAMLADHRVRKLSFTGSTEVGKLLLAQAAATVTTTTMELGGNAPAIVFDDADLATAVGDLVMLKGQIAGQNCLAPNRFLVHAAVHDAFVSALTTRLASVVVGDGSAPGVGMGPLIDDAALAKVERHVADAVERGATVVTGGARLTGEGFDGGCFYPPTVLTGVPADALCQTEETFGPVYAISAFTDEASVVAAANDTEAGLAAYVFTRDGARATRVAEALEFGMVAVNEFRIASTEAPFGGVKASGLGRESGHEGLDAYVEIKTIATRA